MVFHATPEEHLEKLRRVARRITQNEMHADDMDDFCKTAWHLVELVEKYPNSTREMRRRASLLRQDHDLIVCEHAANTEKHGKSRRKTAERAGLDGISIERGYGVGRYSRGGFGIGEQKITFNLQDGSDRNALDFVAAVLGKWEKVFESP